MLDAIRPIALQLEVSGTQLEKALEDIGEDAWEARLGQEPTNHAAFIALHVLDARCFLLRSLGVDAQHGFEALTENARRLEDITEYPSSSEILDVWSRIRGELGSALEAMTADALAATSPHRFPIDDETMLGLLAFLAQHEAYHVGQLGIIRRAHGRSGLYGSGG